MSLVLNVPYSDKDEVKKLGAWWIPEQKSWVIPDHVKDINPFKKWIPFQEGCIVRKPYLVASAEISCWKCRRKIPVIALGAKHYFFLEYDDDDESDNPEPKWFKSEGPTLFSFPHEIDERVLDLLMVNYPFYQYRYSKTAEDSFWANTCKYCGILQSTFEQHEEPGGVFCPLPPDWEPNPVPVSFSEFSLDHDYHIQADHGGMGYDDLAFP
ncbi:MAG TPA: DUF5710 domain-containing protein [Pedobacter sp.]|uniref:DUF5710 domain-containing protein n=1 Tax=Pedobacter sp. TaxID=1411316 RepID=UPI002BE77D74|nr:DUF5710 domain-containing protein [Pedobacter sp.]HMI04872.1 DUF5710 domain-containing protein [Pedobacter sp.]